MKKATKRKWQAVFFFPVLMLALVLGGCGGGKGELSTEVVNGVAAVGLPLSGQVTLKDASDQEKVAVIDKDGSFAFDVTGMKAPFILRARGSADGKEYRLHSFAEKSGRANVNPLSDAIVACAGEVDDAAKAYDDDDDGEHRRKVKNNLSNTVNKFLVKLQPLLERYNATQTDPITSKFIANHMDLDKLFDDVRIRVIDGNLSIINDKTGAVIYSGNVTDIANGNFYPENIPPAPTAPQTPGNVTATAGAGQITLAWAPVSDATSYNLYYSTSSGVTTGNGTKITPTTNGYLHAGLADGTSYYYVVTAVNSGGESAASAQVQASTNAGVPAPSVPAAPTGVSAVGGTSQATISWSPVAGATSYNIYWSKTSGVTTSTGTKLANATTPAVQAGLDAGTTYYYIVTAVNATGEGQASLQVAATTLPAVPAPTAPGAVTGLAASGGQQQVSLSWQPVANATSYNVYWSSTPGVTKATGTRIPGATSPYVVTGLSAGSTYYYIVTAQNGVGEGIASAQASATTAAPPPGILAAPTGVTATGGANQISVNWTANGATSYNLYWSPTSGVTTATGTKVTGAARPFVQTGLSAGATYYYIVTAVNSAGESPASAQASATTNPPLVVVPPAPAGVGATGGTKQVTVTWPAVSSATSYNIYYSTTTGVSKTSGSKIVNAASPYIQTGLADGTTYYFIVTAVNGAGEGAASAQASAATAAPVVLDGQALYNQYCSGCHGTSKQGKTVAATQNAITANIGGMGSLSTLSAAQLTAIASTTAPVVTPPPAPACGTCHAIPPANGKHAFHNSLASCATCHGTGYSTTAVNATVHANGVKNLTTTIGWNATNRSCSNSCHGSKSW